MEYIDAHVHLGCVGDDWIPLEKYSRVVSDALGSGAVEQGIVVVEALHEDALAELGQWRLMLEGTDRRVRYVCAVDMLAPERHMRGHLREICSVAGVVGARHIINYSADEPHRVWPRVSCFVERRAEFETNLRMLAEYHLSFDLQINYNQVTEELCAILEDAGVSICVDHMLLPQFDEASPDSGEWRRAIARLSRIPHVYIKLSMTPFFYKQALRKWWLDDQLQSEVASAVSYVVDTFGENRCMFASNFPVDQLQLGLPFTRQWASFIDWVDNSQQILHHTARAFYRF